MSNLIQKVLESGEKNQLHEFVNLLHQSPESYLLRNEILIAFYKYCGVKDSDKDLYRNSNLGRLIYFTQEIILDEESLYLVICPQVAQQEVYRLFWDMTVESVSVDELVNLRDKLVGFNYSQDEEVLKIDFQAFDNRSSRLDDSKTIASGVNYLNRYLSSKLFDENCDTLTESLFNFLKLHKYNGQNLLINERIRSKSQLCEKVKRVLSLLENYPRHTSYENFRFELRSFGFEPGWGNTAFRTRETFLLLDRLINSSPDYQVLENFISRIPMIFKILVTSDQESLKTSDSGVKMLYILEGVKELEKQIQENAKLAGLYVLGDIEPKIIVLTPLIPNSEGSNYLQSSATGGLGKLEKIYGSNNCWILRVASEQKSQGSVNQNWISPFEIYPYAKNSVTDSQEELLVEFQGQV